MSFHPRVIKLPTKSGLTTLKVSDISALCVNEVQRGMLKKNTFDVDIHMVSGSIFTATFEEADLLTFQEAVFPTVKENEENE
jgi:hypothetical protein